jgi:serine/threonine-protein kinase
MASSAPPPQQAPEDTLLADRYHLERRIGQGGMAEVWVATDTDLDRKVAVKWLKTNLATDPVVTERFRREAIAVARLTHPNIVAIHDVFVHEGRQAVVMQLVDGKSLRQLLDSQRRLGPELTIHLGAAIAGALDEAHRAGFVHRDVKPGNILVTSDGRVLLTDFGIAKGLEVGDEDLTSDNVMMGTAKYLSPEQVRGRRLDGRADIYSLGLVLYECLAGRVPFLGESDADTALARLQRDPTDLGHLRPTLPIGLVNLIHKTLARNPAHRPQTGADLRAALLAVDTTPPVIDGTPAEPPPRIANPPTRALGAGPGVPGDPHVSGVVPVTRVVPEGKGSHPADSAKRSGRLTSSDDTPPATEPIGGTPARQDQQRWTPSLIAVGTLLVVE